MVDKRSEVAVCVLRYRLVDVDGVPERVVEWQVQPPPATGTHTHTQSKWARAGAVVTVQAKPT